MPVQELQIPIETIKLHAGQREIVRNRKRFNVLRCGRRFGKTKLGIFLAVDTSTDGEPVGWFAPSYKYLIDPWNEISRILSPLIERANQMERRISLSNGGAIDFWTMEDKEAGRGRKYRRIIIDEAGIIRELEQIYTSSIRPTLTDLKGDAWFLGTPKGRNFFNQCYIKGQNKERNWASWCKGTIDNPTIEGLAEEIASARHEMPDKAFEQEYMGLPADDGANPFGLDAIKRCVIDRLAPGPAEVYGIDLAKSHDWTWVIGLNKAGHVCVSERWQSDWRQTMERILNIIGRTPALLDSTGVGDPIVEDIQRKAPMAEGFKFTQQTKQQIMEGLASGIQKGTVGIPDGMLRSELESFEFEYTKMGVRYTAPAGLHDDGVCALALAYRKLTMTGQFLPFTMNVPASEKLPEDTGIKQVSVKLPLNPRIEALMGNRGWE